MDEPSSTTTTTTGVANGSVDRPRPASSRQDLPEERRMTGGPTVGTRTTTATMLLTQQSTGAVNNAPILRLSLRPRTNVSWDQSVVDNEGLGRKSSKRCCIFHKQKAFGESSTESSEDEEDGSSSSSSGGDRGMKAQRPMTRKKKNKNKKREVERASGAPKVPEYQRFHA